VLNGFHLANREFFAREVLDVAPEILGCIIQRTDDEGTVTIRITEVEAYLGDGTDPGSHAFRGRTRRNATMYGPPGHLYAYFSYGMHVCANIVCSPEGTASALLLRGGEIVDGLAEARSRRTTSKADSDLAKGPARLTIALGIGLGDDGADLDSPPFELTLPPFPRRRYTPVRARVSPVPVGERRSRGDSGSRATRPYRPTGGIRSSPRPAPARHSRSRPAPAGHASPRGLTPEIRRAGPSRPADQCGRCSRAGRIS